MGGWDVRTHVRQIGGDLGVVVSHQACSEPHRGDPSVILLLEDPTGQSDTLTRVALRRDVGAETVVHLHWARLEDHPPEFHLLLVEGASRLFLAAGEFVGVLDYQEGCLVNELRLSTLYGLSWQRGCVVLRSELECLLLSPEGVVLGRVPVDPPWEERETREGLEFRSEVAGRQILRWPRP